MESTLAVIATLVLWRLVVSVVLAAAVAVLVAVALPSHPAIIIGIIILGIVSGTIWQSQAWFPDNPTTKNISISWPVALLALAFVGLVWGGLLEFVTRSPLIAFAVLVSTPFAMSPVVVAITHRPLSAPQLLFGSFAISSGYASLHVTHFIASHSAV